MSDLFTALEGLWEAQGGPPQAAPMAAGIALAESGGDPTAANPSDPYGGSYGLFQINGAHAPGGVASAPWIAAIEVPGANAAEAVALSDGGTDWQPWQGDRLWNQWNDAGEPPYPTASEVQGWLAAAGAPTGTGATPTAELTSFNLPGGPLNPLNYLPGGSANILNTGGGLLSSATGGVEHLVERAMLVLAGLGLTVFGIVKMFDPDGKVTDTVAAALPEAAAA